MRRFYEITYSSTTDEEELMVVERDELGDFQVESLWLGKSLQHPIPADVRLYVDSKRRIRSDYVPNRLSWPICSERFVELLLPLAAEDVELLDAPLMDVETCRPAPGYKIMNVVKVVRSLALDASTLAKRLDCAITPVFDASKIPSSIHIFRPAESLPQVMFSEELVTQFRGKGLVGFEFIAHKTV
jgi:Immunity protein family (Imm11)